MTLIKRTLSKRLPLWMLLLVVVLGLAATIWFSSVLVNAGQRGKVGQFAVRLASMPSQLRRHFKKSHHFRPWYGGDYAPLPNGLWRNPDQPFVLSSEVFAVVILFQFFAQKYSTPARTRL